MILSVRSQLTPGATCPPAEVTPEAPHFHGDLLSLVTPLSGQRPSQC